MVDVPCNGCRLCCQGVAAFLTDDELDQYEWTTALQDGKVVGKVLKWRDNGDCFYLGDHGCTIHDRAPKACKDYDCRAVFKAYELDGVQGMTSKEILERGRELLNG